MARKKKESDEQGVPRWFVTYSDVITLLMTFFILLLTFASSEPEGFELMQQALFGSGGSSGTIGEKLEALERDSYVVRIKPTASRLTTHGSEMPPLHKDPVTEAASKGLKALTENNDLSQSQRFLFEVPISLFFDSKGKLTEVGKKHLSLLANQMQSMPLELTFTASMDSVTNVCHLVEWMNRLPGFPTGRVGVSVLGDQQHLSRVLLIEINQLSGHAARTLENRHHPGESDGKS